MCIFFRLYQVFSVAGIAIYTLHGAIE
jgi:hypothetical protein